MILAGEVHNPLAVAGVLALTTAIATNSVGDLRLADAAWAQRPYLA
jgi:hypothetical protein